MLSEAGKVIGTELSKKYSFRSRKQIGSQIRIEEPVDQKEKSSRENELLILKKGSTKEKTSKRQHLSIAYEERMLNDSLQKEGLKGSVSGATRTESKKLKWEPDNWREVINNIREMRRQRDAPVDTMGCDKCADESAPPKVHVNY